MAAGVAGPLSFLTSHLRSRNWWYEIVALDVRLLLGGALTPVIPHTAGDPWSFLYGHFSVVISVWSFQYGHFSMVTSVWSLHPILTTRYGHMYQYVVEDPTARGCTSPWY